MKYLSKVGGVPASLSFLLCFIFSFPCFSQEAIPTVKPVWNSIYDNPKASFSELREDFNAYWKDRTVGKGHGYKPFRRWEAYMAPRIFPTNDMSLVNNTYFNYVAWKKKQGIEDNQKSFSGNWTPLGPFTKATGEDTGVGRLNMVRFEPGNNQVMYVGAADGGLWKSTNGGASWSTNTDFLGVIGVADLAIHPTVTNTMYLATGDVESDRRSIGVLKTTDGGANWNNTGLSWTAIDDYSIRKLLMHPGNPQILLAATNKGIFRTTDGGVTWSSSATAQNFKDMEFKPGDPNTVYACSNSMWKSTNNGVSWTRITNGVPVNDVVRLGLAVTPAEPGYVYLIAGKQSNGGLKGIYRSTNSGNSFSTQFEPVYNNTLGDYDNPNILGNEPDGSDAAGQSYYTLALAASPTDPDFLLAGGVSQWASTDGGESWYISSYWAPDPNYEFVHADTHEIVFSSDGTKAFSSHDGGLAMYTDNATGDGPWTDLSNNLNISQQTIIGMSASNPNRMAAGLQDIGTILNTAPSTWKVIGGGDGEYCFIDYTNDDIVVETGTNGSHAISYDGGLSFTDIVDGLPTDGETGEVEFQSPIHQDPMVPTTFYAGGRKHLYYSQNRGASWIARGIAFPENGGSNITEFKIAPSNHQIIYATNGFNLAKSTDAGISWDYLPEASLNASVTQIAISNVDPDKVWVTYSGYVDGEKVYSSIDGGDSWTNISDGLPNIPFNTIVFQNGSNDLVYVGGDIGVYCRGIAKSGWTLFSAGLPNTKVSDLKIFYPTMKIRAATYGRGTWESDAIISSLPVTLKTFEGENHGKINKISWVTTEETDLAYYEVERSSDGNTFNTLSKVLPLSVEVNEQRAYNFSDNQPYNGLNYYRLKMTDLDGSFEYSHVITLFVDGDQNELSVFPNPTTNILHFKGLARTRVDVSVLDALGRTVIVQTINTSAGLDVSRLPNGTYYLEISSADEILDIKRFVKE
ncbi:T9SS type A sorting domain-containing protein [Neolewinella agarilytica]|uniref:Por secretion system C-terminal sorting domain-containing protein n=1 Tax=Neolewinella agarilytica TaxID=478744 RepID=A0A1H9KC86_9BACT|nr:T9SS type A sorting domain-containing protein [Neolewinella agarilytica]SEQ96754.1 Por secretion system C-terminal sorting domain-containing protein [Neolewinella agarilytica]